jgi:F-box interacting protein
MSSLHLYSSFLFVIPILKRRETNSFINQTTLFTISFMFIRLPEATTSHSRIPLKAVGFGFQPETNEYKVIKMWVRYSNGRPFQQAMLEIHTLGTPSWRNVEVDDHIDISRLTHDTYVNGTFHWIRSQRSILCFSLESEKLQLFPSPPHVFQHNNNNNIFFNCHISMGELKGLLYIFDDSSPHNVTMWVMKNYGIGESWTKVYNINTFLSNNLSPHFGSYWPIKHFEEGAAILSLHSSNCFIFFEPGKYGFKVFRIHGIQSKYFQVIPHIPSLISLKDVVKGDNVEVLNIHSR